MDTLKNTYLTFSASGNTYGVTIDNVVEILEYVAPESRPTNLPYLLGLVEHRDNVVPLIDGGLKFGMKHIEVNSHTCTIVLAIGEGDSLFNVALAVDEVSDVIEFNDEEKQPLETSYKPGYVTFAIKKDSKLILAIDANKVFTDTEVVSIKEILNK